MPAFEISILIVFIVHVFASGFFILEVDEGRRKAFEQVNHLARGNYAENSYVEYAEGGYMLFSGEAEYVE